MSSKCQWNVFLGMLDYMMWPWMERIPVMDKLGMSQPEIPGRVDNYKIFKYSFFQELEKKNVIPLYIYMNWNVTLNT